MHGEKMKFINGNLNSCSHDILNLLDFYRKLHSLASEAMTNINQFVK
jgi:hypothetical protein